MDLSLGRTSDGPIKEEIATKLNCRQIRAPADEIGQLLGVRGDACRAMPLLGACHVRVQAEACADAGGLG
jgi:hypothetical protein